VGERPWRDDPRCLPIPWREVDLPEKLRIGVMWHDGMVIPTPPVTRALKTVVEKLRATGVEVIDWDPVDHVEGKGILDRMFLADGGVAIRKELQRTGEPFRPEMQWFNAATGISTYEMWQLHLERTAFQKKYLDRWTDAGIDAILCPSTPFSGVENGKFKHGVYSMPESTRTGHGKLTKGRKVGYTGVYNVLDYSCVSFPTGLTADKSVDQPLGESHQPLSRDCEAIHAECEWPANYPNLARAKAVADVAAGVDGMPISLQLVARRLEEENVLALTRRVLKSLGR